MVCWTWGLLYSDQLGTILSLESVHLHVLSLFLPFFICGIVHHTFSQQVYHKYCMARNIEQELTLANWQVYTMDNEHFLCHVVTPMTGCVGEPFFVSV